MTYVHQHIIRPCPTFPGFDLFFSLFQMSDGQPSLILCTQELSRLKYLTCFLECPQCEAKLLRRFTPPLLAEISHPMDMYGVFLTMTCGVL